MKKKTSLPQTFQKMLRELKQLDDELGITISCKPNRKEIQEQKKEKERKQLLNQIWQSWPRKVLLDKNVLQMRSNALKNPEVKILLEKHHIRIEDCALVDLWDERYVGWDQDCPGYCSPENIQNHLIEFGWGNNWRLPCDYHWGGPKDTVKILFNQSNNNRFKAVGVIQMFPEKEKKAA